MKIWENPDPASVAFPPSRIGTRLLMPVREAADGIPYPHIRGVPSAACVRSRRTWEHSFPSTGWMRVNAPSAGKALLERGGLFGWASRSPGRAAVARALPGTRAGARRGRAVAVAVLTALVRERR